MPVFNFTVNKTTKGHKTGIKYSEMRNSQWPTTINKAFSFFIYSNEVTFLSNLICFKVHFHYKFLTLNYRKNITLKKMVAFFLLYIDSMRKCLGGKKNILTCKYLKSIQNKQDLKMYTQTFCEKFFLKLDC